MNKSTSFHKLTGDKPLSKIENKLYFLYNRVNNLLPNFKVDPRIVKKDFVIKDLKAIWKFSAPTNSPTRKLCDFFWHELPWNEIKKELKEINILDIGCGTGRYAERFINFSNKQVKSYLGIDIYTDPNTKEVSKKFPIAKFELFDGKDFQKHLKGATLITSQSAFEHIEEDLNFFRQLADFVKSAKHPVIQIHLVPSAGGLNLFRNHGFRQYTPRNISKLTRLFGSESTFTLYSLGGQNVVNAQYKYVTKPILIERGEDLRETQEKLYNEETYNAIKADESGIKNPAFYALVIQSNVNQNLF